ncbi:MAG TPA: nuclear transport factor 2 family protein [Micromonosporaceae bacterium]
MITELATAVRDHCELFNNCVRSGDWRPFAETFTEDAEMVFVGVPFGPVVGRPAILAAYTKAPPREELVIGDMAPVDDDTIKVDFTTTSGKPGGMIVTWRGDQVARTEISMGR